MNRIPPLLGATVGFVVGLLMACQQYEASILLITAIILAVTLQHVVQYAKAARRQARTAEWTAGVQLLSRSVLFVTDPIKTIGEYAKEGHTNENLGGDKSHWLMIEITNEGDKKAMNIHAWAEWKKLGFDDVDATPSDRMRPLCKCDEFDGEEKNVWTEWRLPPGQSRLFYFRPPSCPELTDPKCGRTLRLRWYDVAYPRWTHDITIFKKDGTWHTGWEAGPDLDDPKIYRPVLDTTEKE